MPRQTHPVIRHVPLTEARATLGAIVNDVNRKSEYVVIERGGLPVAVIMDFDELEDYLELRDPSVRERIAEASREYHEGKSFPAEDLIPRLQQLASTGQTKKTAKKK